MKFQEVKPGEWIRPKRSGFFFQCCDCNKIHRLRFRLIGHDNGGMTIEFQAFNVPRSQAHKWFAAERKKARNRK